MAVPQTRGDVVSIKPALSRETEREMWLQVFICLLSFPALHILNLFQALLEASTSCLEGPSGGCDMPTSMKESCAVLLQANSELRVFNRG